MPVELGKKQVLRNRATRTDFFACEAGNNRAVFIEDCQQEFGLAGGHRHVERCGQFPSSLEAVGGGGN